MGQAKALNWTAIAALTAVAVASGSGAAWLYWAPLSQAPGQRVEVPAAPVPIPPQPAAPTTRSPPPQATAPQQQATAAARPTAPQASTTAASGPQRPRFDVVRVGLRGTAVVAGRAAPGAEVTLYSDGQQELGRSRADARGEWVILPAEALPAGSRELSLRARLNGEELDGADTVVILVPEAPAGTAVAASGGASRPAVPAPAGSGTLAVLMPTPGSGAAPRVLQAPPEASLPRPGQQARLALSTVDYGDAGDLRFAGTAPPNSTVRVYLGERHAGDATTDETGRWTLTPARPPAPGRMTLRVDQVAAGGGVAARIEQPIENSPPAEGVPHDGRLVVQPGHNLWRIARQAYGQGTRYTVIFAANRDQIRDPHRIYPGQVFAVPDNAPPTRSN